LPTSPGPLAEYLRARRAQLRPEDVGFPPDPGRRVRGLRRAEIAELAGISLEYYTRLEQGRHYQMSETVLSGLTRALQLSDSAAAYFYRIALPLPPVQAVPTSSPVSDLVVQLVEGWSGLPVYVADRNQDIILANDLAHQLFPALLLSGNNVVNSVFTAPNEGRGLEGWKKLAHQAVAALRFHGDPADLRLQEIVGTLSVRDADFRRIWADHVAQPLTSGTAPVLVDGLGFGDVPWQALEVPGGYSMVVYLAPAGTFAEEAIRYLRQLHGAESAPRASSTYSLGRTELSRDQFTDYLTRATKATRAAMMQGTTADVA
jgi:transcriptional regulator with XRE-family HTH domain